MKNLKYISEQRVDIIEIKYRNGETKKLANQKCLEILKKESLKIESVRLFKNSIDIEEVFSKEICNRWINLLVSYYGENVKASYTITNQYHIIELDYSKFDGIGQLYINLILFRYLWYMENNFLIYRTLDILEKYTKNLNQAIILAHYYDLFLNRDPTFNLFSYVCNFNRSIFSPIYEFSLNKAYDSNHNKKINYNFYTLMYNYLCLILTGNYISDYNTIKDMWEKTRNCSFVDFSNPGEKVKFLNLVFNEKLSLNNDFNFKEGDLLINVKNDYDTQIAKFVDWYLPKNKDYIKAKTVNDTILILKTIIYTKIEKNEN